MTTIIRPGKKTDLPRVHELIVELAIFEKAPDAVENTVAQMEIDGFGPNPIYGFFVAENSEGEIVGTAIYYYRYSTWKGKRMYLEDLIVTKSERGQGLGEQLLETIIEKGKAEGCSGVMWQVLDWNESAINFYKNKFNAQLDPEWINCSIDF